MLDLAITQDWTGIPGADIVLKQGAYGSWKADIGTDLGRVVWDHLGLSIRLNYKTSPEIDRLAMLLQAHGATVDVRPYVEQCAIETNKA